MNHLIKIIAVLSSVFLTGHVFALEKPEYQTLYEEGKIEYRLYDSYIVAETTMADTENYSKASNQGFSRLFDYISGDNINSDSIAMTAPVQQKPTQQKISMTAPVQQSKSGAGWTVAFMLPSKFSLETAPKPLSSEIEIRKIPERLMAVIRYSGRWTQRNFDTQTAKLKNDLEKRGIEALSTPEFAAYNPPFVPPFMRRNEIMIEVDSYPNFDNSTASK